MPIDVRRVGGLGIRDLTTKLAHGYAMELTEGEAQSLLAHAASHDLGVAAALREELAGHERRKREEKP
jgi:predicted Zn-dependent protease